MPDSSPPPLVLTFAASDPTGGAGMQADLLTIAALGCHPLSVLTGFTVQDTRGVASLQPVDGAFVAAQARALLADLPVRAFKLGVLATAENAKAVAGILAEHPGVPVVLDPVLASGRGDALASDETIVALREHLLARCTIVTPNSVEARRLAQRDDLGGCARELLADGCRYVLITGTHEQSDAVVNVLYGPAGPGDASARVLRKDSWPRLPATYHGSGCTLASAIACALAREEPIEKAVRQAQQFTWNALRAGFRPGSGQHLPDRFFAGKDRHSC